jgi:indole-3-glycerol phosphate synthase
MKLLDQIVKSKQKEIDQCKSVRPVESLNLNTDFESRDFISAIRNPGFSIIAEIKGKSPSAGILRPDFDPLVIAGSYEQNNADCLSILTDSEFFGGSCDILSRIKNSTKIPILRKDFIIDSYQIHESKAVGADAILLIVHLLERDIIQEFLHLARHLNLACLVEVHSREELETAIDSGSSFIGINNRDLDTLEVNLQCSLNLRPHVPDEILIISESGMKTSDDIRRIRDAGFHGVLIGESLMRADDPGELLQEFKNSEQN